MSKKLDQMSPKEIRERGRELLRLAQQKEKEVQQRQLVKLGEIFRREIEGRWLTPWSTLQKELEDLLGVPVERPSWSFSVGGQGGAQAPLVEVQND